MGRENNGRTRAERSSETALNAAATKAARARCIHLTLDGTDAPVTRSDVTRAMPSPGARAATISRHARNARSHQKTDAKTKRACAQPKKKQEKIKIAKKDMKKCIPKNELIRS